MHGGVRMNQFISARSLEFTIITAARTCEIIGAEWDEMDMAARLWTVPAVRVKDKKYPHDQLIPLSPRAIEILKALPRESEYVFPGGRPKRPLSNAAMLELVKPDKLTVHGFRSTFRDWSGDCTNFDRETIEFALGHGITNKTEAA
jgi:integrase